jgi:uncharacterized protein (DUF1919 family)
MTINNDNIAKRFDELTFENKVGFYYKNVKYDSIVCLNEFSDSDFATKYSYIFKDYVVDSAKIEGFAAKPYDIFKLLCGEKDYIRKV